jgi:hypothetical protein
MDFDFPIGAPRAYAERTRFERSPETLLYLSGCILATGIVGSTPRRSTTS